MPARSDLPSGTRIGLYLVLLIGAMPLRSLLQGEGIELVIGFLVPLLLAGLLAAYVRRTAASVAANQLWTRIVVSLFSLVTGVLGGKWLEQFSFLTPRTLAWVALLAVAVGVLLLRIDRKRHETSENENNLT